jgi:hypothetical protein
MVIDKECTVRSRKMLFKGADGVGCGAKMVIEFWDRISVVDGVVVGFNLDVAGAKLYADIVCPDVQCLLNKVSGTDEFG